MNYCFQTSFSSESCPRNRPTFIFTWVSTDKGNDSLCIFSFLKTISNRRTKSYFFICLFCLHVFAVTFFFTNKKVNRENCDNNANNKYAGDSSHNTHEDNPPLRKRGMYERRLVGCKAMVLCGVKQLFNIDFFQFHF